MEVFEPANLLIEAKAAGSLGNILCAMGAYLGKSFLLYQNMKEITTNFKQYGIEGETLTAKTCDLINLSGYLFWPEGTQNRKELSTVIFFHENAGTIGQRFSYFAEYVKHCNCNLIVFGYRGYSKSPGHPSNAGIKKDGDAIMEKIFKDLGEKVNLEKIYLHGKSLGGGVASYIASQEKWKDRIKGVILDSTFNSVASLVTHYVKSLKSVAHHVFANEMWDVVESAKQFNPKVPVLVFGVSQDEICPYVHSLNLNNELLFYKRNSKRTCSTNLRHCIKRDKTNFNMENTRF